MLKSSFIFKPRPERRTLLSFKCSDEPMYKVCALKKLRLLASVKTPTSSSKTCVDAKSPPAQSPASDHKKSDLSMESYTT